MKKKWWKRLWFFPIGFIFCLLIETVLWMSPTFYMYHANEYIVYGEDEKIAYSLHYNQFGNYLTLSEMSPYLPKAIVAYEDKRFYSHHGLDYKRILKSALNNIQNGKIVEGASTITQQYARTLFLNQDKTFSRKMKEAWIARKIEMDYSKDEILEGYLNCAYFGHNLYGVDAASHYYFHKDAKELTLAESALLIGILSAPTYFSPDSNYELAQKKKEQVLLAMKNENMITESEYIVAKGEKMEFYFSFASSYSSSFLYYHDALISQLKKDKILTKNETKIGYQIFSTLDVKIQNQIDKILQSHAFSSEISVVVMKPNSGDVLALIGGKDYQKSSYNRATHANRQTGSTIKPLLYYLGLEHGMSPLTKMRSEETTFYIEGVGEYAPKNASNTYANRDITMLEAIALSDNIYATKTTLLLGSKTLSNFLKKFQIQNVSQNPTIGLGTNSLTPLELTAIYNAFASEGAYYSPRFYKKANSLLSHSLTYTRSSSPLFYLHKENVLKLNHMLRSPYDPAFVSYTSPSMLHYAPSKRFAIKTGSTDTDRWVIGFNPFYTLCIWMGNDNNEKIVDGAMCKILFKEIADALMEKQKDVFYSTSSFSSFSIKGSNGKTSFTYYK